MRDPLNGDWIRGYTQALLDIKNRIQLLPQDLKYHHSSFNFKNCDRWLDCYIKNRENLRESEDYFIRSIFSENGKDIEFELYKSRK